jgi:FHS family L-fucose permease-like MFS transporter
VAQFFYVGAQICVWTYTIHYTRANLGIGGEEAGAWLLASIIVFSASRFVTTYLMTFFAPVRMLAVAAGLGVFLVFVVITAGGLLGSLALVGVSAVMSLMFPTIYGIALRGLGPDSKLAAAGLIMAIVGGALLTPLQGAILDGATVAFSYLVPAICFLVVGAYALWVRREAEE